MSKITEFFISSADISPAVIEASIKRYLGPDAECEAGERDGRVGFWVAAPRTFTLREIEDLLMDSRGWELRREEEGMGRGAAAALSYKDIKDQAVDMLCNLSAWNEPSSPQEPPYTDFPPSVMFPPHHTTQHQTECHHILPFDQSFHPPQQFPSTTDPPHPGYFPPLQQQLPTYQQPYTQFRSHVPERYYFVSNEQMYPWAEMPSLPPPPPNKQAGRRRRADDDDNGMKAKRRRFRRYDAFI